jgi:hypothetical protein
MIVAVGLQNKFDMVSTFYEVYFLNFNLLSKMIILYNKALHASGVGSNYSPDTQFWILGEAYKISPSF